MENKKEHCGIVPFTSTLVDTEDGTGDAYLPLSDELIEEMGWKEGDNITLSIVDGVLILSKE